MYDLYYSPARPTAECLELLERQTDRYPFHGDGRVRCVVALQAQGTASDDLLIGAKANYAVNDYEGIPREDDHYGAHLYGKYMLYRHFYATLTYDYRRRDSSESDDDFTKNLVMLKLEAQL